MSDTKDNRLSCEEIEELVPELLYGELDDARAEQVRAQLPECELDGKVAAYERMREAFRSLPDEEPPAAITAQLLHAAAKQVEGKAVDGEGFWSKLRGWFQPIVMSPGFAAAASILVIGGVVGVLYMKSADQRARPDVATRAEPPAESRELAPSAPAGTATAAFEDSLDEDEGEEDPNDAPPPPVAKEEQKPSPKRANRGRASNADRDKKKDTAKIGATGESTGLLGGDSGGAAVEQGFKSGETVGPVRRGDDATEVPEAPAADDAPEAEPEPAPAPPPKKPSTSQSKGKADPHADARRLHNQARSAAERGDCATARKLTARIKKMDAVYYRNNVVGDRQLGKCNVVSK